MVNNNLAKVVQDAARDKGLKIMELNELCADLNYARVSKVWNGISSVKFCDVEYVLEKLGVKVHYISKSKA